MRRIIALILLTLILSPAHARSKLITQKPSSVDKRTIMHKMKKIHIPFITNKGQLNNKVKFYAKTFGGIVFVTDDGNLVYQLSAQKGGVLLKEIFMKANIKSIKGEQRASTKVNYFRGKDKNKWFKNIPTYAYVSLGEIYKGIELKIRAYGNNVEKLFYVSPYGRAEVIRVRLEGAKRLEVTEDGRLKVLTEKGAVYFTKPLAYQEIGGRRQEVKVAYVVKGKEYGFKLGEYDTSKTVVIDPLLASTYLGGDLFDDGYVMTIDKSGNVYVAGKTTSDDFPTTPEAYDEDYYGYPGDTFISKFNPDLSELLASTFLGGSKEDIGYALAVDDSGNVYVAGETNSVDFPTTTGAYNTNNNGAYDVFVSRFDKDLSANQPPVIDAFNANPTTGEAPLEVNFECQAHDDTQIVEYRWDFDGDGQIDQTTQTNTTTHTYQTAGTYNATCTVVDNDNATATSAPIAITVTSSNQPPVIDSFTADPTSGGAPLEVNFECQAHDNDGQIVGYRWNFGDGNSQNTTTSTTTHI